jgi:hypothetical protein
MTSIRQDLNLRITEADFQRLVIDYARLRGWRVHHSRPAQYQSGRWATHIQGDPGFPDLVLARRGVVIFAEMKAERGRLSDHQETWRAALAAHVWRPSDWDQVMEILR